MSYGQSHCPKCQGSAAREWLAEREAELLTVPYYHMVFTVPAPVADLAYQNKEVIYDILFKASAETMLTIAADPKHLGARIGITSVLHTWGSAMTHHPHVHMIAPGGGISLDGTRWVSCKPGFFLPVRVLSRLYRRLFLEMLIAAHKAGRLKFFSAHTTLAAGTFQTFAAWISELREIEWVTYAKRPFGGPQPVLAYLSLYTHRIAISNRRLVAWDDTGVTFNWKDYRIEGADRYTMAEFASGAASSPPPAISCLGASPTPAVARVVGVVMPASEKPAQERSQWKLIIRKRVVPAPHLSLRRTLPRERNRGNCDASSAIPPNADGLPTISTASCPVLSSLPVTRAVDGLAFKRVGNSLNPCSAIDCFRGIERAVVEVLVARRRAAAQRKPLAAGGALASAVHDRLVNGEKREIAEHIDVVVVPDVAEAVD